LDNLVSHNEEEYLHMDKNRVFSLEELVTVLVEDLPEDLLKLFQKKILSSIELNVQLQGYLSEKEIEWKKMHPQEPIVCFNEQVYPMLVRLIFYELDEIFSANSTEDDAFSRYWNIKKQAKKRLYGQMREEVGLVPVRPRNPFFIRQEWDALHNPFMNKYMTEEVSDGSSEQYNKLLSDFELFKQDRFSKISAWSGNKNSYLMQFMYYDMLQPFRMLNLLVTDIVYECLSVIINKYYKSKEGFLTRTIDTHLGFKDAALFGWESKNRELKYEITDSVFRVYELMEMSPSNRIKIVIHEAPCDKDENEESLEKLFLEFQNDTASDNTKTLDAFDMTLLTVILNAFSYNVHDNSRQVKFTLPELVSMLYQSDQRLRPKMYERVLRHIIKIGRINISNVTTEENVPIFISNFTFYEYKITINSDLIKENSELSTVINMASGDCSIDYSKLDLKSYAAMEVEFYLSNSMYTHWNNRIHTYISTTLYQQIETAKGKMIVQLLQDERLRNYPELDFFVPYSYFLKNMNVSGRNARFKKELEQELSRLAEQKIIVKGFELLSGGVFFHFYPLNSSEKKIYRLE